MKAILLTLIIAVASPPVFAQYKGGSGKGNGAVSTSSLSIAASTMYAGGSNDGTHVGTATSLSLSTSSQYSGGSGDGHTLLSVVALSLATNSSYSGGPQDGATSAFGSALPMGASSMYTGEGNDGFNLASASSLALGASTSYSGGSGDGLAGQSINSLNLGTGTMYAGGVNDGTGGISVSSVAMSASGMYSGGGNDGFSSFTAAALPIVALPIVWEDFSAVREGKDALLRWQVGNERDDEGFEIERSYDGGLFSNIGFVPAVKGISSTNEYQFTDPDPARYCPEANCTKVFYRLRQVALNGHFSYSPVRRLALDAASLTATVYPNPASDRLMIRVNTAAGSAPVYSLSLSNSIGATICTRTMLTQALYELDVREYPSGTYYLKLTIDGRTYPYLITIAH